MLNQLDNHPNEQTRVHQLMVYKHLFSIFHKRIYHSLNYEISFEHLIQKLFTVQYSIFQHSQQRRLALSLQRNILYKVLYSLYYYRQHQLLDKVSKKRNSSDHIMNLIFIFKNANLII